MHENMDMKKAVEVDALKAFIELMQKLMLQGKGDKPMDPGNAVAQAEELEGAEDDLAVPEKPEEVAEEEDAEIPDDDYYGQMAARKNGAPKSKAVMMVMSAKKK